MPEKEQKRRSRWRRFLLIYAAVFLLLGAAGCFVLWRYAGAWELSRPERAMDALMEETDPAMWKIFARDGAELDTGGPEDGEALFDAFFERAVSGAGLSYRKTPGVWTEDAPVYTVRGGGADLCTVRLEPAGRAGFGRTVWQAGAIRSCFRLADLQSVPVFIEAPQGETVFVNGEALPETYLTGETAVPPGLTALESRVDAPPAYARWRVEAMYGEVSVTDRDGRVLSPEILEDGSLRYVLPPERLYALSVTAPEGARVFFGGAELDAAGAEVFDDPLLAGLEEWAGTPLPRLVRWKLEGLYALHGLRAVGADGAELDAVKLGDGAVRFFPAGDEALQAELEGRVHDFFDWYFAYAGSAYNVYTYNALLNAILPESELYAYVRDSAEGMVWASATEIDYDELRIDHFRPLGENAFTCTLYCRASLTSTSWYETHSYELESSYELAFVLRGWTWYAAAMSVLE